MKKLIPLLLFPLATVAQKNYVVSGKIPGLTAPAMAYLDFGESKDSVQIKNGKFEFKGTVDEPKQVVVAVKRDYKVFWLENSKISLVTKDSLKNAVVKGSSTDKEYEALDATIKPNTNKILKLMREADTKPSAERRKEISDSIQYYVKRIKAIRTEYAQSHPNTYIGLFTYNQHVLDAYVDIAAVGPVFDKFSAELKASPLGQRTVEKIEAAKRRSTGAKATDFTQNDLNDHPFTLSSLRGKYVLVDFWASWCKPCRAENPNVVKAYNELKGKNFEIVGVSLDQGKAVWEEAVKKDGLPWIHVSDLKGWKNAVAEQYGISSVPQNLLINPEGVIIAKNLRGEELAEKLKALIK